MNDRKDPDPVARRREEIELQEAEPLDVVFEEDESSAIAAAEEKLRSARKDLEDLKDRHLRKLAEFENVRKRAEREKAEYRRAALSDFLTDLLPVADSFERALAHAPAEARVSDFGQGIALIQRQIGELWKKYGVREVDTSGTFDPNLHEAVATEATDEFPKDTILEVLRKGYSLNDRLLRPAWVKVAVKPASARREENE